MTSHRGHAFFYMNPLREFAFQPVGKQLNLLKLGIRVISTRMLLLSCPQDKHTQRSIGFIFEVSRRFLRPSVWFACLLPASSSQYKYMPLVLNNPAELTLHNTKNFLWFDSPISSGGRVIPLLGLHLNISDNSHSDSSQEQLYPPPQFFNSFRKSLPRGPFDSYRKPIERVRTLLIQNFTFLFLFSYMHKCG